MIYNKEEIVEYAIETIRENIDYDKDYLENDTFDIHQDLFNSDYYIIGTYKAKNWLGDEVFEIIDYIKDYENKNYGQVVTDFSNPEAVVNMYVYIIGEEIIQDVIDLIKRKKEEGK